MFSTPRKKNKHLDNKPSEVNAVIFFLETSGDLKNMRRIALDTKDKRYTDMINNIDKAQTFSDVLQATQKYNFINSKDTAVDAIGPNGIKTILYLGSFFYKDMGFSYYAATFRDNMEKAMTVNGFKEDGNLTKNITHN